ncbi:MAG: inositol monophosphatase family protein [Spirochaetia bacterium]
MRRDDEALAPALRSVARDAAFAAGRLIRGSFGRAAQVDREAPHDVKLWVDRASEEEILRILKTSFPGHAVLSEERGFEPGREPYLWIVDPLDGTVNFHHGIPFFCTSIACHAIGGDAGSGTSLFGVSGSRPDSAPLLPDGRALGAAILGIVYDPLRDELFAGAAGGAASLNRGPLLASEATRLDETVISLSFGAREESIAYMNRVLPALTRCARKVRSFGSTALDMVQVAAGRVGAFVQMGTNLWDFAGAAVVVRAAGGVVDVKEYGPGRFRIIASARGIFEEVRLQADA